MRIDQKRTRAIFLALWTGALLVFSFAPAIAGDKEEAEQIFAQNCAVCHGADRGGFIGPALTKENLKSISEAALRTMMITGIPETLMPPWGGKLTTEELRKLAALVKNTSKADVSWGMEDIKRSLQVYVAEESTLPSKPTYPIEDMDDLMAVMSRGRYATGNSRVVFFDGRTNRQVGEIATTHAPHLIDYHPTDPRWAYVKTDSGYVYKVDLYSMRATRSIRTGFNGPPMGISRDGRYLIAGSFIPHTAVILDAKTLEPVKFLELKGRDPDGHMVESRSGMVTGTPFADYLVIALKDAGQVWIIEYNEPGMPVTVIENVGRRLHDAFLTGDGRYLMIASYEDNIVAAIDLQEKKIAEKLPGGCQPHVGSGAIVEVKGQKLGVGTNIGSCDKTVVSVWDLATWQVVKQIPVLGPTESPAAHPKAPYIVVDIVGTGPNADKIQLIDKEKLEVVKTVAVGGHSHFPEYTARGDYLYVSAGYQGDNLVIYRSDSFTKVAEHPMEVPAGIFSHVRPKIVTVGLGKTLD